MRPVVYDLCCGRGGWARGFLAEGFRVIGFDIHQHPDYPGQFIRADVRALRGETLRDGAVIVASPPCEEFSRHEMPWCRRKNPPEPDLSIVAACFDLARRADAPIILENVRKAQTWLGIAKAHYGSRYLWGDVPPMMPYPERSRKENPTSAARDRRSEIPFDLARFIAQCFRPVEVAR